MSYNLDVGSEIKRIRKQKGIKAKEFSDRLGMTYANYWKIETNRNNVGVQTLFEIAEQLNVPLTSLVFQAEMRKNFRSNVKKNIIDYL